jgi:hypothetical protein
MSTVYFALPVFVAASLSSARTSSGFQDSFLNGVLRSTFDFKWLCAAICLTVTNLMAKIVSVTSFLNQPLNSHCNKLPFVVIMAINNI